MLFQIFESLESKLDFFRNIANILQSLQLLFRTSLIKVKYEIFFQQKSSGPFRFLVSLLDHNFA